MASLPAMRNDTAASAPQVPCPAPAAPAPGSDLPVLALATLKRTAAFLKPAVLVSHLKTLTERGETLLRGLRGAEALTGNSGTLASSAHVLAGSAGMFGFERLAFVACRFETAVQSGAIELPDLAKDLSAALEVSIHEMRCFIPAAG